MLRRLIRRFVDPLAIKVELIEQDLAKTVRAVAQEDVAVLHYGAFDIDARHLVYWVCVQTDAEKHRLESDAGLRARLRSLLIARDYPQDARESVHIGFESQETVDRESGGSWPSHWQ
jgi:hypothetical protein